MNEILMIPVRHDCQKQYVSVYSILQEAVKPTVYDSNAQMEYHVKRGVALDERV